MRFTREVASTSRTRCRPATVARARRCGASWPATYRPDLVTLGKPMGNGYPVAAVIGPAELIDPFVAETDYFSTFGGSTAACAAALAVLRVIEDEQLVSRAADVGARLFTSLREATADRSEVADVRGWGLALAVDLVEPSTGEPDAARAQSVVEGMRERGVLVGRTGRHRATLKIRPPLVFGEEHVGLLVDALADALRDASVTD
ncbi:aminotransferase class III-fold pyridoxal phosphate-dependent enzyme [Nocardioides pakistanensis]